jgi:hypothetical protein
MAVRAGAGGGHWGKERVGADGRPPCGCERVRGREWAASMWATALRG